MAERGGGAFSKDESFLGTKILGERVPPSRALATPLPRLPAQRRPASCSVRGPAAAPSNRMSVAAAGVACRAPAVRPMATAV